MYTPLITISAIIAAAILLVLAPVAFETYRRYRNRKVIICPENHKFAEVELKACRAGVMSAFGKSKLAVKWCSRWQHKQGCAEDCVKENWLIP
jgi:hypothetical protein